MKSYKTVDWSYPTSTNAQRFGFPKGCWTVSLTIPSTDRNGRECHTCKAVVAYAERQDAVNHARTLPESFFFSQAHFAA